MVDANTDFMSLDDNDITPAEKIHLENVVSDLRSNSSAIIEHGYTGKIDQVHIGDIRRSIVISIVSKRQLYNERFENYRPISVLNYFSKLLEKLMENL
jgi:hypothetical protein